jgi:hypothetical protein
MDTNTVQKYAALVITDELQIIKLGKACGQSALQEWDGGWNPVQTNRQSAQKNKTLRDKMDPSKGHTVFFFIVALCILISSVFYLPTDALYISLRKH